MNIRGMFTQSEMATNRWLFQGNLAEGNLDAGYIAFDGANNNVVVNNMASNNGLSPIPPGTGPRYDIELVGWTDRIGPCTPPCHDNLIIVNDPTITVNDCGDNNTVLGGELITPSLCLPPFNPTCPP